MEVILVLAITMDLIQVTELTADIQCIHRLIHMVSTVCTESVRGQKIDTMYKTNNA